MSAKTLSDQLGELIHKAEAELDELRLKIALGKMTGADLFEEVKKELRDSFREISTEFKSRGEENEITNLVTRLHSLLQSGKAEVAEAYDEQKAKISKTISELEHQVQEKAELLSADAKVKIRNETEKFRLKMEIMQIRYELGKLDLKDNIESRKVKFKKEFDELLTNIKDDTSETAEVYGARLKNAYESLRKSLQAKE